MFKMPQLTFMGYLLSRKGIGPTDQHVEAVAGLRNPQMQRKEVQSFLGLVNLSARFIPSVAVIKEPLRKLARKDVHRSSGTQNRNWHLKP